VTERMIPRDRDVRLRCLTCGRAMRSSVAALVERRAMDDVASPVPATVMAKCVKCDGIARHFVDLLTIPQQIDAAVAAATTTDGRR
jgi:hypothetical protein